MAFFRNAAINLLNLHYALHSVAIGGGGAFFAAYLLKAGVPMPGVFLSLALILMGRFVVRPAVVPLAIRFGLRPLLIAGTVLMALQYPFLARVAGVGPELIAVIVIVSIADAIYWSTYHATFAALGDDAHRGQQLGAREALAAVAGIGSPLLTGWLLVTFGPEAAFGANACAVLLSVLPLLRAPAIAVKAEAPGALRAARPGFQLFVTDGFIAASFVFVWQVALFLSLGEDLMAFGGALAIAALVGAVGGLLLGRHIDAGHGGRAVAIAFSVFGGIIVLRAFATDHAIFAVAANALGVLGACLYVPAIMTPVYTLAKRAPCVLRFHVVTEGGWDLGGATGLLIAALLAWIGAPLWASILISLIGLAGGFILLRRYYAANPNVPIDAIAPEAVHP